MGQRVKVTGFIELEDDEFDSGPNGPLTAATYEDWAGISGGGSPTLADLDDLTVEKA